MAATALDMITVSLQKLGVYAPGEPITDADAQTSLTALNDMLDSWSNETLMCYAITEQSGLLVPGQSAYTIGAGGQFNMTRPLKLIPSPGSAYMLDATGYKYDLQIIPQETWNLIGQIENQQSNIPTQLFYDPQFPLGILNFFPMPNQSITAYWDSYLQLTEFPALTTPMSLPPGYKKAIQDNLTIDLVPFFKPDGYQVPAWMARAALDSKAWIKRTNQRPAVAYYDPEIVSKGGTWNIYSDSWNNNAG